MGLLFAWATPEYLLWQMTIGQIVLYHNLGLEIKYPKPPEDDKPGGLSGMSYEQLQEWRDQQKGKYGAIDG